MGSPYEFDCNNIKTKQFRLFRDISTYTDDSILILAQFAALNLNPKA